MTLYVGLVQVKTISFTALHTPLPIASGVFAYPCCCVLQVVNIIATTIDITILALILNLILTFLLLLLLLLAMPLLLMLQEIDKQLVTSLSNFVYFGYN